MTVNTYFNKNGSKSNICKSGGLINFVIYQYLEEEKNFWRGIFWWTIFEFHICYIKRLPFFKDL